jgi:hypothetical protein
MLASEVVQANYEDKRDASFVCVRNSLANPRNYVNLQSS